MRVRPKTEHAEWAGADCVVKGSDATGSRVKIERVHRKDGGNVAQSLEIPREQLYDAGETGMLRLLGRVRCAYIRIDELRTKLTNEDIYYASQFPGYHEMLQRLAEVRTGKRKADELGEQAEPRERYGKVQKNDIIEVLRCVLTQADGPDVIERMVAERVHQHCLYSLDDVDRLVAERLHAYNLQSAEDIERLVAERVRQTGMRSGEDFEKLVADRVQEEMRALRTEVHINGISSSSSSSNADGAANIGASVSDVGRIYGNPSSSSNKTDGAANLYANAQELSHINGSADSSSSEKEGKAGGGGSAANHQEDTSDGLSTVAGPGATTCSRLGVSVPDLGSAEERADGMGKVKHQKGEGA